jgi:hypothetical protein
MTQLADVVESYWMEQDRSLSPIGRDLRQKYARQVVNEVGKLATSQQMRKFYCTFCAYLQ